MSITATLRDVLTQKDALARAVYKQLLERADESSPEDVALLGETLTTLALTPGDFDADRDAIARAKELRSQIPDANQLDKALEEFNHGQIALLIACNKSRNRRRAIMEEFKKLLAREAELSAKSRVSQANYSAALTKTQSLQRQLDAIVESRPNAFAVE